MKKTFSLVVLILTCCFAEAQTYVPFPVSNTEWSEIYYQVGPCEYPYCKHSYFMQGDTLIGSIPYHKIYYHVDSNIVYLAGLREDSKRIYARSNSGVYELLIYDFNLNIGDSIKSYCSIYDSSYFFWNHVTAIDSVLLPDAGFRKRFHLSYGQPWIEGIGCESGLFSIINCVLCVCWNELVCLKQNGTTVYLNETHEPCFYLPVTTQEIALDLARIDILPNPTNQGSLLNFECKNSLITSIEFYNLVGNRLKAVNNIFCKRTQISVDDLSSGFYLVKVQLSNKDNIIKKLIIE